MMSIYCIGWIEGSEELTTGVKFLEKEDEGSESSTFFSEDDNQNLVVWIKRGIAIALGFGVLCGIVYYFTRADSKASALRVEAIDLEEEQNVMDDGADS